MFASQTLAEFQAVECTLRFRVRQAPESVGSARQRVRAALRMWGVPDRDDLSHDIQLTLSELLSNAVVHGLGPLTVAIHRDDDLFIVEVFDMRHDPPVEKSSGPDDEGGRGMAVVRSVAYTHGCDTYPRGKRCWAVLKRR